MDSSEPSDPVLLPAACLRRSVSAASDQQQQQYFHVITNNKEGSAADWTAPQQDSTTEALIGYHWEAFKLTVALDLLVRESAGGWSRSVISPPPSVDIRLICTRAVIHVRYADVMCVIGYQLNTDS